LETPSAIKPPLRTALPPGEHNGVAVYALSPAGKESGMIQNPQNNPDHQQNVVTPSLALSISSDENH